MKKLITIILISTFILVSCSSSKLVVPESEGEKLFILYEDALKKTKKRKYIDAALIFEDIERQYPYSSWAGQSQLMAAFCYLRSNMHDESLNVIDRYLALNPGSEDIDYAYYMKGMNYFNQISDVTRDQSISFIALKTFEEINNRFPDSEYANDSKERIKVINDRLAGKEINIAMQYQKDHQWVAAINRYNNIIDKFKKSRYAPEALHRLVEIYLTLGVIQQAEKYAATLGYNYPDSYWYKASYKLINKELKTS
ncbi:outer membrane protein assembly factor BamD [Pelagibacterales bacterium]|nr:outer membrane protein assembly factor BamD [Pelagibacterales bacterium]